MIKSTEIHLGNYGSVHTTRIKTTGPTKLHWKPFFSLSQHLKVNKSDQIKRMYTRTNTIAIYILILLQDKQPKEGLTNHKLILCLIIQCNFGHTPLVVWPLPLFVLLTDHSHSHQASLQQTRPPPSGEHRSQSGADISTRTPVCCRL